MKQNRTMHLGMDITRSIQDLHKDYLASEDCLFDVFDVNK